jgi:6-phosphofructokinase
MNYDPADALKDYGDAVDKPNHVIVDMFKTGGTIGFNPNYVEPKPPNIVKRIGYKILDKSIEFLISIGGKGYTYYD